MSIFENNQNHPCSTQPQSWGAEQLSAILHQIQHALQLLQDQSQTTVIDLMAFPFAPGDEDCLLQKLGKGEVTIELDSLGVSSISETGLAGVWLVDHRNEQGERIAFQLEIAKVPALVMAQESDIADAVQQLSYQLGTERELV